MSRLPRGPAAVFFSGVVVWAAAWRSPQGSVVESPTAADPAIARTVALLDGLEPRYPHYVRNRRELAHYRALARAGEPEPVPALSGGRKKIEPGRPWAGVTALRTRLRILAPTASRVATAVGATAARG